LSSVARNLEDGADDHSDHVVVLEHILNQSGGIIIIADCDVDVVVALSGGNGAQDVTRLLKVCRQPPPRNGA